MSHFLRFCLTLNLSANQVRVFDGANGTLLWEAPGQSGSGEVFADAKRVYFENNFELGVYDIESGRSLWKMRFLPHRWHSYDSDEDTLYIRQAGSGDDVLYTLDARTGDVLNSESLWTADHFLVFARFPQFDLHILTVQAPFTLRAVDPVTQQTLWQVEQKPGLFLQNLKWPPVLLDDLLLLDVRDEVLALDARNGQIRWRSFDPSRSPDTILVTGYVIMDDSPYALRRDARLVRWDARSGKETGYIKFAPPILPDISRGIGDFFGLAADGQMLFVSFDDSDELIALGP